MTWLLTGGAGYIGAHVLRSLRASGRDVVVIDDLSTGIAARVPTDVPLVEGSINDRELVTRAMRDHRVTGVVHLAAKKAVGESVELPLWYYRENVDGLLTVLEAMTDVGVPNMVYSSSAAVYGDSAQCPIMESDPTVPVSPYGETKLIGEWAVAAVAKAQGLSWASLRYFNVAGAAADDLGDTSVNNLIPIVLRSYSQGLPAKVFGDTYPTPDGTCLRDYIHVADLADAHTAAADFTERGGAAEAFNIGTGFGSSVLEVIASVAAAVDNEVPVEIVDKRPGDPAELIAAADKSAELLGWTARLNLDQMTASAARAAGL